MMKKVLKYLLISLITVFTISHSATGDSKVSSATDLRIIKSYIINNQVTPMNQEVKYNVNLGGFANNPSIAATSAILNLPVEVKLKKNAAMPPQIFKKYYQYDGVYERWILKSRP